MKISVLIIAHNEELYIAKCIESILLQSQKADEIVLILHNSTDSTRKIAEQYPITIVSLNGLPGVIFARIEGLRYVTGEIICCIDGDSYAKNNWIAEMIKILARKNILVGSWVKFKGTLAGCISNFYNKYQCVSTGEKASMWIWGPSFAFWFKDKSIVENIYKESIYLSKKLGLSRNPEDYWLALFMSKKGNIAVINTTHVSSYMKEKTTTEALKRGKENSENGEKMYRYFKQEFE